MDWWTGLCFFNVLCVVCSLSEFYYSVNLEPGSFEEAQISCRSDNSFLTNIPNHEETLKILKAIEDKRQRTSTFFWIGLMKYRKDCVQDNVPLKGFHWTADNSTEFELNKWEENPEPTCTNALCGQLSVEYTDSKVIRWGLAARTCKQKFSFICKHQNPVKEILCPLPQITGSHTNMQKNNDPYNLQITCNSGNTFTLTCSRSTSKWGLVDGTEKDIAELCLDCRKGYKKDEKGNCVDVDECEQSNLCKHQCINTAGSYSCMCVNDIGNFYNETSEICKNLPRSNADASDKLLDNPTNSPVHKKSFPSFQPANDSTTESGVQIEGGSGDILFPLIIALLILVVLIVITAVIVKCCCMRWKKKRAKKRAAVLKEAVALNGSDSMEKVYEK
ncbi:C-type lectin domain family 14 member A [Trichomycterus rosablanca]|uniref:C-type lectin domain family 14 member A n=1 Tax=Trichomycterus rosablanca TaxID=2290929 RepID=UPI002F352577